MLITNCSALIDEFGSLQDEFGRLDGADQEAPFRCTKYRPCNKFGAHPRVTQRAFSQNGCVPAAECAAYPQKLSALIALKVNCFWREHVGKRLFA